VLDEQAAGVTRLIVRTRGSGPCLYRMLLLPLFYPADFLIARLMLRTVRQRLEQEEASPAKTLVSIRLAKG